MRCSRWSEKSRTMPSSCFASCCRISLGSILKNPTIDAVYRWRWQHCFNPVLDMLAKAEAEWDGNPVSTAWPSTTSTPTTRRLMRPHSVLP